MRNAFCRERPVPVVRRHGNRDEGFRCSGSEQLPPFRLLNLVASGFLAELDLMERFWYNDEITGL